MRALTDVPRYFQVYRANGSPDTTNSVPTPIHFKAAYATNAWTARDGTTTIRFRTFSRIQLDGSRSPQRRCSRRAASNAVRRRHLQTTPQRQPRRSERPGFQRRNLQSLPHTIHATDYKTVVIPFSSSLESEETVHRRGTAEQHRLQQRQVSGIAFHACSIVVDLTIISMNSQHPQISLPHVILVAAIVHI